MNDFTIPVRTSLPADQYKTLNAIAERNSTTVGQLVAELVRRGLQTKPNPPRHGPVSRYTPELGQRILALRRLNRSYDEIGADVGIAAGTARTYLRRVEAEKRAVILAARNESEDAA